MSKGTESETSAAGKLLDYVNDAIELQSRLDGWRRDTEFKERGGTLIYSVDVDIIVLYLRPAGLALPSGNRHGYTQIFRHDKPLTSCALADGVCDAIFFDKEGRAAGTILLDVFETEFVGLYHGLLGSANKTLEEAREFRRAPPDMAKLKEEFDAAGNDEEKYKVLKKHAPGIAKEYFRDTGSYRQLDRLSYLLSYSNLLKEHQYRKEVTEEWSDALIIKSSLALDYEQSRIINPVKESLMKAYKEEDNAVVDAKAVARLAVLNRRLSPYNVRIIHITGDKKLFAAAGDLPAKAEPAEWSDSADLDGLNFAEAFIRHPSSFLASSNIIFSDDRAGDFQSGEGILGLLDVLVTEVEGKAQHSRSALLARCEKALADFPDAIDNFESSWRNFVTPLLVKRLEEIERRTNITGAPTFFTELSEEIDTTLERRWMKFFTMTLPSAFNFVDEETEFARDVPLVWFDCAADDALHSIQDSLLRRSVDRTQSARDYRKAVSDLSKMTNYEYFSMLTFAALFGGNGRWKTTLMLTEQAIAVAESNGERHREETVIARLRSLVPAGGNGIARTNISGREAYYLASIASKITSESSPDLDRAGVLLDRAFERLQEDQEFLRDSGQQAYLPYVTSSRFEAEALSLDTAKFLFARFPRKQQDPVEFDKPILTSAEYRAKIDDLLERVGHEPEDMIRLPLRRRLIINLLSRFLFDSEWQEEVRTSLPEKERLKRLLAEIIADESGPSDFPARDRTMTYLGRAVTAAAHTVLDMEASRAQRKRREKEAFDLFDDEQIKRHSFASFDAPRYRELKKLSLGTRLS